MDECHRGSARDESNWREILEYFEPAFQIGMTATPLRQDNKDTYAYFGNPLYTYSLKQGIEDGFLAPYRVHRVVSTVDAAGWRPTKGELDRYGREIPDGQYSTKDFERLVSLKARTQAIARNLTDFLKKTDRFGKTIVFCVDQEHAEEMRKALNNCNADIAKEHPEYVVRVVSDEGQIGRGYLDRFMDVETLVPTLVTTSQMMTTGVDVPTCRNIVLTRVINSMTDFKQIIGRGTRVVGGSEGGRCGMVVPNGVLFGDGIAARIKEELLREFNLHTVVRLPNGVFAPYTSIPANLLFFDRTGPTKHIWYYEQPLPEGRKNYTKTAPIQFEEFTACLSWWKKREENERAWKIKAADVLKYDSDGNLLSVNLDIKNPRAKEDITHLPPEQLAESILHKEQQIAEIIATIRQSLTKQSI